MIPTEAPGLGAGKDWGRALKRSLLAGLVAAISLLCRVSSAEEPAAAAAPSPARALFDEGRSLVGKGDYAAACPKFEKSLELEVGIGTQFHLADCWEHIGRPASAQKLFLGAAATAKAAGQSDREQVLRERAAALDARVPKLVIEVSAPEPQLLVKRDKLPLEPELYNRALAVDPGSYELTASAPGKQTWKKTIQVLPSAQVVSVQVPKLEPEVEADAPPASNAGKKPAPTTSPEAPTASSDSDRPRFRRPGPVVFGLTGLGIAGAATATVMALRYKSKNDEAQTICPSSVDCSKNDIILHTWLVDGASRARTWAYVGSAVGVSALAGAAVMYFVVENPKRQAALPLPALAVTGDGEVSASLLGTF